jgi:type II secretion system (T2SS) protein M
MSSIRLPDGRLGQALAVFIALVLVIVVEVTVISPLLSHYAATAQSLQDRWDAVERYRNAVNDLPQLRAAAQVLQKTGDRGLLLKDASDSVAAANLQSTLKEMIEREGSKLTSAQTLPPETEGKFHRIGLRIAFATDLKSLTTLLLEIETSHPVLSVSNLDLRSSGEDENQTLSVAMDITGFRQQ